MKDDIYNSFDEHKAFTNLTAKSVLKSADIYKDPTVRSSGTVYEIFTDKYIENGH